MADIAQVVATGSTTVVGVAVGAGLTYWFGALTRRRQEAREDATRWYQARLEAYRELSRVMTNASRLYLFDDRPQKIEAAEAMSLALGPIHLVGSEEVIDAAERLVAAATHVLAGEQEGRPIQALLVALRSFKAAARRDLGHPQP